MRLSEVSVDALAREMGERLKRARLNADVTQAELATRSGLSRKAVQNAESGQGQLTTYIALMVGLNLTEQLDLFLPPQDVSPVQLAKLQGKQRQRASGQSTVKQHEMTDRSTELEW